MRTNIELNDELVAQAMRHSGARTKRAAVEAALRLLVRTHSQGAIRKLRGKVKWEGSLEESRLGRFSDVDGGNAGARGDGTKKGNQKVGARKKLRA